MNRTFGLGPSSAVTLKYYRVRCALGLEDSFHPKGCAGLVYLLTEAPHIGDVECLRRLFFGWLFTYLLSSRFDKGLPGNEPLEYNY